MIKAFLNGFLCVLAGQSIASAKDHPATSQPATVVEVKAHDSYSPYMGSNPSDAPLQSPTYTYDVWLRSRCVTYEARYDSWSDQPDPMFIPNRVLEVRPQKHVLNVSGPGGTLTRMSILTHSVAAGCDQSR